jgi:alkylation response protein AidB-like acyl-CoA dehydrogenase
MTSSSVAPNPAKRVVGGAFLIEDAVPADVFTPEDFTEEQRQIAQATADFAERSVLPRVDEIEAKDFAVTKALLRQAGELGLLAVDVPEQYGGLALNKVTSALIADRVAVCASFSVSFSAHAGIGTLPLAWYGTDEQKEKYLGKLASGEWVAAYALSEASSGSDAMNIRTQARLSPDGRHYILNGEKMWTSNAAIASLFTVFAKIDGEKFSAFLVEAGTPGLTIGKEEHKMGIRGSSTCPLAFSDCIVPVENLLGEPGKGHRIAFNILNVGRYKLGAAALGGARIAMRNGIRYGKQRIAFGKPVTAFGLIQEKIAESAALIFAGEALVYRVVGAIDTALADLEEGSGDFGAEIGKRIEEYAIECSIVKVWCSEMLERVVDQMLQIYGGYGYTAEYPAERSYRDARINRIFEGTNEINRLIIAGWMMKRAAEGRLALLPAIQRVMDELLAGPVARPSDGGPLAAERALLSSAKRLGLFSSGAAHQKYAANLADQQEVMGALADIVIEVLAMESAILRAEKMQERSPAAVRLAKLYAARSFQIVQSAAERVIGAVAEGDALHTQMAIFRRLSKHEPANTVALGREVAEEIIAAGRYTL